MSLFDTIAETFGKSPASVGNPQAEIKKLRAQLAEAREGRGNWKLRYRRLRQMVLIEEGFEPTEKAWAEARSSLDHAVDRMIAELEADNDEV